MKKIIIGFYVLFMSTAGLISAMPFDLLSVTIDTYKDDVVRYGLSTDKQVILAPGVNLLPENLKSLEPKGLLDKNNCLILSPNDPESFGTIVIYKFDDPKIKDATTLYFVYKGSTPELDSYLILNATNLEKNFTTLNPKEAKLGYKFDADKPIQLFLTFNPYGSLQPFSIMLSPWVTSGKHTRTSTLLNMYELKKIGFNLSRGILGTGYQLPAGIIPCN